MREMNEIAPAPAYSRMRYFVTIVRLLAEKWDMIARAYVAKVVAAAMARRLAASDVQTALQPCIDLGRAHGRTI